MTDSNFARDDPFEAPVLDAWASATPRVDLSIPLLQPELDLTADVPRVVFPAPVLQPELDLTADVPRVVFPAPVLQPEIDLRAATPTFELYRLPHFKFEPSGVRPTVDDELYATVRANFAATMSGISLGEDPSAVVSVPAATDLTALKLAAFQTLSDRIASEFLDLQQLPFFADSVERLMPSQGLLLDAIGEDVLQWAFALRLGGEDEAIANAQVDAPAQIAKLRQHLEGVADWLLGAAATFNAGLSKMNSAVDNFNENMERYQTLLTNLLKVSIAIGIFARLL